MRAPIGSAENPGQASGTRHGHQDGGNVGFTALRSEADVF